MKKNQIRFFASVQTRITAVIAIVLLLVLSANVVAFRVSSETVQQINQVFASNAVIVNLADTLQTAQGSMYEYLSTKSSSSLENFYRYEQELRDQTDDLNDRNVGNELLMLEKNIRSMTQSYLTVSEDAIQARRGRNVEEYKASFARASELFGYINDYIYTLNSRRFAQNTENYLSLLRSMRAVERMSLLMILVISAFALTICAVSVRAMIGPLGKLSEAAERVAGGDFSVDVPKSRQADEVGVVTNAFHKMLGSIRTYIESQRASLEKEAQMKENELSMEAHLKEAQLKFLQAQINPHFLFNSLNAGSQLAMMEGADRTELFLSRMAQFFRYNVKKTGGDAALSEEIASVDNYIYILNVRFSGDIHYEKQIDETVDLEQMRMPSMILQPIVENAIQHGIHDDHENGIVTLAVDPVPENENESGTDCVRITVSDNGTGMIRKQIEAIMDRRGIEAHSPDEEEKDSTGIAMENVISRLELYYNRKNLFSIWSDGPGTGTEVTVLLPKEPDTVRKNGSEGRSGSDYGTGIRPDLVRNKLSSTEEKDYVSDSDSRR